jgi:hypothetical protein
MGWAEHVARIGEARNALMWTEKKEMQVEIVSFEDGR